MNKKIIEALSDYLSDAFTLYLKTHNFHWHIQGDSFIYLHEFLDKLYTNLFESVDVVAERIRALEGKVPASMADFLKRTKLKESVAESNYDTILKSLIDDHKIMIDESKRLIELCNSEDDQVTLDMMVDRLNYHEKTLWMLKATRNKA